MIIKGEERMEQKKEKGNFMEKVATVIVDKRNLFFLIYIFAIVFCLFSMKYRPQPLQFQLKETPQAAKRSQVQKQSKQPLQFSLSVPKTHLRSIIPRFPVHA